MAHPGSMDLPKKIFVDTSALVALYNETDGWNIEAEQKFKNQFRDWDKCVTSDYVVSETYTGLLYLSGYKSAALFDADVKTDTFVIERVDEARFWRAREVFLKFNRDKKWSFVDCTSYVLMKELKMGLVFTFDRDFEQMGFEVI